MIFCIVQSARAPSLCKIVARSRRQGTCDDEMSAAEKVALLPQAARPVPMMSANVTSARAWGLGGVFDCGLRSLDHEDGGHQDNAGDDLVGTERGVEETPGDANGREGLQHLKIAGSGSFR